MNSNWKQGLVQSKAISLFVLAASILTPISSAHAAFGDGSPTIPNQSVFSGAEDAPKVDVPTGAFTQNFQLDIPPGRNGMQPDIALNYNSQNPADSIVGYGWTLSIPYIQRLNKVGSENLYDSAAIHFFSSSIDGEIVATTTPTSSGGSGIASVETNSYGPASWTQCTDVNSVTFQKTVSATSTLLIVHVDSSKVSGVTYAGIPLSVATSSDGYTMFYIVNPTPGTSNVVVSFTSPAKSGGSAVSYTGTDS